MNNNPKNHWIVDSIFNSFKFTVGTVGYGILLKQLMKWKNIDIDEFDVLNYMKLSVCTSLSLLTVHYLAL